MEDDMSSIFMLQLQHLISGRDRYLDISRSCSKQAYAMCRMQNFRIVMKLDVLEQSPSLAQAMLKLHFAVT